MKRIMLCSLLCYALIVGCTSQNNQTEVIGVSDSTTSIVVIDSTVQQCEIDNPISVPKIEKYKNRVTLQRLPNVPVTHPDAYKIETQKSVYSPQTKRIQLDVINVNAPSTETEYHWIEEWKDGKWVSFPFIDNLAFAGVGSLKSDKTNGRVYKELTL